MPQAVTMGSLPEAFEFVKGMQAQGPAWARATGVPRREAITAILQGQMAQAVDEPLDRMGSETGATAPIGATC
jgi:hypothetical protein